MSWTTALALFYGTAAAYLLVRHTIQLAPAIRRRSTPQRKDTS
ncbi:MULTISPECIES: hypothetical protein [Mycobacteriaceae]|nr:MULTISPECIES: hypothetical protein [Mycobacteriaceae]